ncbi:hypothetical protein ACFP1I_25405 [Dyadobacter subterraneus]|uniref:Uncharacterized protein n=1 Tax=Dyadobacter subterraneus TaxID=2773304 RepID=A0ABR9WK48_9BACT|nr:hypothetical protein [Dyadobacter subterraneus]MBE9465884.1 hypothetical protein [Dyadobacter subterraneus]
MFKAFLDFARTKTWLALVFCLVPVLIYIFVFKVIALNVNYVAFDDILILGIIPGFEDASWPDRWRRLTELFPEHRLVFSRSIILLLHSFFGRINMVWPMIVANICWAGCAYVFYSAFKKLRLSLWYFVPVMWLWFNIQSFENIFWGVSSLCNYGVLLFVLSAIYFTTHNPKQHYIAIIFATIATFTYGNGLMVFPVIGLIAWLMGRKRDFFITVFVTAVIAVIYFIDFTPITQNLNFSDPKQVKEGFLGYFGFIGSIATISAYDGSSAVLMTAVVFGFILIFSVLFLFRKQYISLWNAAWRKTDYTNSGALFSLGILAFVAITTLALVYKRIPTDTFEGMFKGRYRMYSTLWCIALYFGVLSLTSRPLLRVAVTALVPLTMLLNLVILDSNFVLAINNRRMALVQEFNARYNADWLGIKMFSMDQAHFEKIRAYYRSDDPLAEGWNPRNLSDSITCAKIYQPDIVKKEDNYLIINFENDFFKAEKDYSDGAYVILKSPDHTYAAPQSQSAVPIKTTLRRLMYFNKGAYASFHTATIEPGFYRIYFLVRKGGINTIYCTGKTWKEE